VKEPHLGVLFTYPDAPDLRRKIPCGELSALRAPLSVKAGPSPTESGARRAASRSEAPVRVGVIGAGNYARLMLLPRLKEMRDVRLVGVATARGVSADDAAKRFGFAFAATDPRAILDDPGIDLVVIATRHDSHAALAAAALAAGKHVFVEKPLATNEDDLRTVVAAAEQAETHLMVGFNRRFAPLARQAREKLRDRAQPLAMVYRVNAGALPASHWARDPEEGGGRIIGEVCHFIDLLQYLCGSAPVSVFAASVSGDGGSAPPEETVTITLRFADGSIGSIHYFANGHRAVPKEYLEVYGGGRTLILDDFRRARWAEGKSVARWKSRAQDKGQRGELEALLEAIRTGTPSPIPLAQAVLTTLASFRILDSLRWGRELPVDWTRS
jgi:predicted dehydrogenase